MFIYMFKSIYNIYIYKILIQFPNSRMMSVILTFSLTVVSVHKDAWCTLIYILHIS